MALNHQRHTDKWWETEYSDNIHSYLQYHEVKWRMVYGARSPQIHLRPVLLKTIRSIAKTCEISNVCVHLAVTLMDLFMDNHDLKFDTIMLVSFACLTLAAKIEEHCLNIPKLKTMQNVISKDVTNSHFRKVEMKILMFFEFNVAVPTVAHFIEFYKDHFYCDNDFYHNEFACILKDKFNNMIISYQDASLESIKLISYNPSIVAASIILTTRHTLGLVPCWTAQLRKVTGYLKKDLVQCCSLLGRNVMQHRKLVPVDEGYLSSSPGFQSPVIMASKKKRSHIDVPNVILSKRTAF
ncbi:cyclin-J-like [Metopolophium dirhodum]|uniref:cyclin-J-like n=1 Tax=Metopolophium dirhodum TaxID=44670 RepID=UPI00298F6E2B|nr:cyclin-J-like [Metopolophium dirhodum]